MSDRVIDDSFDRIDAFFTDLVIAEPYMVDTVLDVFSTSPKLFSMLNDVIESGGEHTKVRALTSALEECINGDDFLTYTQIDDNGRKHYGFVDDPLFEEHLGSTLRRADNSRDCLMSAKCLFFVSLDNLAELLEYFLDPSNYLREIITEDAQYETGKFDFGRLASGIRWAD